MTGPVRVFLVDDHEVVRRGLADMLADAGMAVVGEAGTAADALGRIAAVRPDVAVLDVRLPDGDGVLLCRDVLALGLGTRCIMLTSYDDDRALTRAALAGAAGYLVKRVAGLDLVRAVQRVAAGEQLLDERHVRAALRRAEAAAGHDEAWRTLTEQELRVLALVEEGRTNREIGDALVVSEKTVKHYVSSILAKLGLRSRTEAAAYAARHATRAEDG